MCNLFINFFTCFTTFVSPIFPSQSSKAYHYFSLSIEANKSKSNNASSHQHSAASVARPIHVTLEGKRDNGSGDNTPEPTTVWVHFKAPPEQLHGDIGPPDLYCAKLEVELDVPGRQAMALSGLDLKAVVGIARLHAPTSMQVMNL